VLQTRVGELKPDFGAVCLPALQSRASYSAHAHVSKKYHFKETGKEESSDFANSPTLEAVGDAYFSPTASAMKFVVCEVAFLGGIGGQRRLLSHSIKLC
jgi:hypothetical protein